VCRVSLSMRETLKQRPETRRSETGCLSHFSSRKRDQEDKALISRCFFRRPISTFNHSEKHNFYQCFWRFLKISLLAIDNRITGGCRTGLSFHELFIRCYRESAYSGQGSRVLNSIPIGESIDRGLQINRK
jgi:hypothetical protein